MEIILRHGVTYTTQGVIPVAMVARSLLANEALIHQSARLLSQLEPGLTVKVTRIGIRELSNASPLKSIFAAALFITFQKQLESEVPELFERLTGQQLPDSADTLITVLVLMLALFLIDAGADRIVGNRENKKLKMELNHKIERVAELAGIDRNRIEQVLADDFPPSSRRSLTKQAIDLFLPAKLEPGARIVLLNGEEISAEVIEEVPMDIGWDQAEPTNYYDLEGAFIEIHRADRDENKHGWRAVIESVSAKKVRMELATEISPESLYGSKVILGDVTVIEAPDETGQIVPRAYRLNKLYKQ